MRRTTSAAWMFWISCTKMRMIKYRAPSAPTQTFVSFIAIWEGYDLTYRYSLVVHRHIIWFIPCQSRNPWHCGVGACYSTGNHVSKSQNGDALAFAWLPSGGYFPRWGRRDTERDSCHCWSVWEGFERGWLRVWYRRWSLGGLVPGVSLVKTFHINGFIFAFSVWPSNCKSVVLVRYWPMKSLRTTFFDTR